MTTGFSGTDVLLYVDVSDSSGEQLEVVGGQRNVSFEENHPKINLSHKSTGRVETFITGRGTRGISLDGLVLASDDALDALKDAVRNGTTIKVQRVKDGSPVEEADAKVLTRSESFPDNAESTMSISLELLSEWSAS